LVMKIELTIQMITLTRAILVPMKKRRAVNFTMNSQVSFIIVIVRNNLLERCFHLRF